GQTARAQVPRSIPVDRIPQALNPRLPDDIAVVAARETAADFDPRRHCVLKQYSYSIIPGLLRPALAAGRSWQVKWPVDVAAMAAAAAAFVGTHDFTSFCNREAAGGDTVRTVSRSEIRELAPDPAGRRRLVYYVEGRSFLYNMVRALTGTLVGVGTGRFRPGDMDAMLAARDRTAAGPSAPPWGLCLEWTLYEGEARPPDRDGLF
ncbi:MAG: tRNA pseudouridine(38-40) synthase TruA, partial [Planctomycetes bacterium]|nr:tRNA pseudouridine(38-40) synthase TruA [Planctomycetota bacterium]